MQAMPSRARCRRLPRRPMLAGLLLAAGCGGAERPPADPLATLPTWSLVEEVAIGREDDPDYALTPVTGLAVGPDLVYVALRQDAHVRVFDHDGRFVRTIGRRGQGPGEFGYVGQPGVSGDTLWVNDGRGQGWMHYFTLDGTLLRAGPLHAVEPPYIGVGGGNRPVPGGGYLRATSTAATRNPEVLDFPVFRVADDGSTLGRLPGWSNEARHHVVEYEGRVGSMVSSSQYIAWRPFNRGASYAFGADNRYVIRVEHAGDGERVRVLRVGIDGDTLATSLVPMRRQPVPGQVRDSLYALHLETLSSTLNDPARARRELAALDIPETYPAMRRVVVAQDHSVWIEPDGEPGQPWLVLDAELQPRGWVRVPPRHDYLVPDDGVLWAVRLGDFDVPFIVRYRIVPGTFP
jgi:hypothetical protein